jgi:hypothetical protein
MSDIERELEAELHRVLDPVSVGAIPARRALQHHGRVRALLGGAGAALTIKVLTGVAVAAAAVTVAGAATTGSLNPQVWGQQVKQHVATCKDELAQGQHGIGECVSAFSNQNGHGQSVASSARQHGIGNGTDKSNGKNNGNGSGNGNGGGNGSGNGQDKSKDKTPGDAEPTDPSTHGPAHITPGP